jgi:ABC-type Mn2+/Zn2+ transport system permease subunit
MLSMIAITIIVSFQTVGTLLVFGMLLAPAGAGALVARRIETMMLWAALFGSVSVYLGLLGSYHFNLAAGASVVLVSTLLFFTVLVIQNIRGQKTRQRRPSHA